MKISIITINYNNKSGLEETCKSVAMQTMNNYEWIVIDGGSTDGSVNVIEKFAEKYVTYWVSEPDTGIYNAMNKGVAHANGDYCLFLNSGDLLDSSIVLEKFLNSIDDCSFDFVVGATKMLVNKKNVIVKAPGEVTGCFIFKKFICHQATFIKTSLLRKNPYLEQFKIASDWIFMLDEMLMHNASYKAVDIIVCKYDLNGISSTNNYLNIQEREAGALLVLGKRVYSDYIKLCYGETIVEKVACKVKECLFLYKLLNFFSLIVFSLYKLQKIFLK